MVKPNFGLDPDQYKITTINGPLVFIMSMINKIELAMESKVMKMKSPITRALFSAIKGRLEGFLKSYYKGDNSLIIVRSANEILFNGRPDPLLSLAPLLVDDENIARLNGSFSWQGISNATHKDRVTVFTGRHIYDKLNSIDR